MANGKLAVICCGVFAAVTAMAHPLITVRMNASHMKERFLEILEANREYAGSVDEYWFARPNASARLDIIRREAEVQIPFVKECEKAGIAVGFQQGVTLGHGSIYNPEGGGNDEKDLYPFSEDAWQRDRNGEKQLKFCPRSPEVLKYEEEYAAIICEVVKPVSFWLDDDLRLGFWTKDGCFCTNCIAQFNAKYGYAFSRGELVERVFGKGKNEVRRKWREFIAESLAVFGAAARRGVNRVNPECLVAYQSVDGVSLLAGTDFTALLRALSDDGKHKTSIRIGSGAYDEDIGRLMGKMRTVAYEVERVKRCGVPLSGISYEQETYPRQVYHKTPEAIAVESALALVNGCDAVTEYYWDEVNPEPMWYYREFAKEMSEWRGYFAELAKISRETSLAGVARFIGSDYDKIEKSTVRSPIDGDLQALGVPLTVMASGTKFRYVDELTLEEWGEGDEERLLANGSVAIVDAACEKRLRELGGAKVAEGFADGRLKTFDFSTCRVAKYPTHAQREALLDALDSTAGGKMPVRFGRTMPMYVFARVDEAGRVKAVSFYNGSAGRAMSTKVAVRNAVGKRWKVEGGRLKEGEKRLKVEGGRLNGGEELVVELPEIPARQIVTVVFGG